MRIQFFLSPQLSHDGVAEAFVNGLREAFAKREDSVAVVEAHPDLIHVFGAWHHAVAKAIQDGHRRMIPVVYSPLGQLAPWVSEKHDIKAITYQRQATRTADIVHATGPQELSVVERWKGQNNKVMQVANPVVTNTINFETVVNIFLDEYRQLIDSHDRKVRQEIEQRVSSLEKFDSSIRHILYATLYLRYCNHRGTLPQSLLNELSVFMTNVDYDEDVFPSALDAISKSHRESSLTTKKFFVRLEQLLAEKAKLTEGFMPLPPLNDKETLRMYTRLFDDTAE